MPPETGPLRVLPDDPPCTESCPIRCRSFGQRLFFGGLIEFRPPSTVSLHELESPIYNRFATVTVLRNLEIKHRDVLKMDRWRLQGLHAPQRQHLQQTDVLSITAEASVRIAPPLS